MRATAKGIGVYDDTAGSPPLVAQLGYAADLVGTRGWVVLFLTPLLPGPPPADLADRLAAAYARDMRVVVRLGWSGNMRDMADAGSNRTRYTAVASALAAVVDGLPLPPPALQPLLVHAGNEVNACNEWRCSSPVGEVVPITTIASEAAGFMQDTGAALSALPATRRGNLSIGHASVANWQNEGCECGTNQPVGAGQAGTNFLTSMLRSRPDLYANVSWLSSHSYPYSNEPLGSDKASRGLTYYRAERSALRRPSLPAVITETGWALTTGSSNVSEQQQGAWLRAAAESFWAADDTVLAVCPFLLAGRFWEPRGRNFLTCPPAAATAPCNASELRRKPVYEDWRMAEL